MLYDNGYYIGKMSNDKKHGYGVFINSNGVSLLGRWMNDNLIKAIINYEDGSKYIGSLLNGDYHGRGLRLTKSQNWTNVNQYDVTVGLWEYGKSNGTLIFSKPYGLYMKKYFKNGELYKSIIVDIPDLASDEAITLRISYLYKDNVTVNREYFINAKANIKFEHNSSLLF